MIKLWEKVSQEARKKFGKKGSAAKSGKKGHREGVETKCDVLIVRKGTAPGKGKLKKIPW